MELEPRLLKLLKKIDKTFPRTHEAETVTRYKPYAGIGSRSTPEYILKQMALAAKWLDDRDYTLRSGGADGADKYFEKGAKFVSPEIFLPWKRFNGHKSKKYDISPMAYTTIEKYHPNAQYIENNAVRKLLARDAYQILGYSLCAPSLFVLCYTPDGADGVLRRTSRTTGGTGQAIRIANAHGIPVYNLSFLQASEKKAHISLSKELFTEAA